MQYYNRPSLPVESIDTSEIRIVYELVIGNVGT